MAYGLHKATSRARKLRKESTANAQMRSLTDLVKLMIKTIEDQNVTLQHQSESLIETFTQQIDMLKGERSSHNTKKCPSFC